MFEIMDSTKDEFLQTSNIRRRPLRLRRDGAIARLRLRLAIDSGWGHQCLLPSGSKTGKCLGIKQRERPEDNLRPHPKGDEGYSSLAKHFRCARWICATSHL